MAVTTDIVESWLRPRVVVRRLLARGRSEAFVLSFLLIFLLLAFIATAPERLQDRSTPLTPRLFALALGTLATIPFWYLLAALGHLLARLLGGNGSYFGARLALFWALVVISPAMLVQRMVQVIVGGGVATGLGVLVALGFVMFWTVMLREVER